MSSGCTIEGIRLRSRTAKTGKYELEKVEGYRDWMVAHKMLSIYPLNDLKTYETMLKRVSHMATNECDYIDWVLTANVDLKRFLIFHSVFDSDTPKSDNKIANHMADRLTPDELDMAYFHENPIVEDPMVDYIIKEFNGTYVRFETYPVQVRYGDYREPIKIIDSDFDEIHEHKLHLAKRFREMGVIKL